MFVQVKTNVGDLQFLFCDLFLVTLLAIVMGRGGPSEELHPCRPPASLLALPVFGSLFIHVCMVTLGQLAAFFITTSQDWSVQTFLHCHESSLRLSSPKRFLCRYVPLNSTVFGTANLPNMENTCVFTLSGFQYIIMAAVVTKAYPHKKPLYHNSESSEVIISGIYILTVYEIWTVPPPTVKTGHDSMTLKCCRLP